MIARAYYNEFDPFAANWLKQLIKDGLIPDGDVDDRTIKDVLPGDLGGDTQCHFFAGIGGWARALKLADFPDDLSVWTGSCPCQPFSVAGRQGGGRRCQTPVAGLLQAHRRLPTSPRLWGTGCVSAWKGLALRSTT